MSIEVDDIAGPASGSQSTRAPSSSPERASASQEQPILWDGKVHSYRPRPDWRTRVSPRLELHEEASEDLDPVTFEVLRNRLWTSNLAHGETLSRISGSPVFQALDFNMCFLTETAEVVMNAPFIIYLDVGAPLAITYIMEHFSESPGIEEGDMFLASDPWIGASHQMDALIAAPVFIDGKLFAWVSNAGHQIDLGGVVPGGWPQNAPDVYSDPVFFSPIKIVERGVLRRDFEQAYRRQSRFPDLLALDLRAQLAGCRFAAQELTSLCQQFSAPTIKAAMRRIIENAQRSFREKLQRIPDGTWSEVRWVDEKMPGDRNTYRTKISVRKEGDRLFVDNDGTDDQQEGPIGITYSSLSGAVLATLSVVLLYDHLFALAGADRQVQLDPTPGTITCVDYPAAVSGGVVTIPNTMGALFIILGRMVVTDPELELDSVGAQTECPLLVLAGTNDRGAQVGTGLFDFCAAGSAGKVGRDGVDAAGLNWSPLMRVLNAEDVEQVFPIMYLYRRERVDGGGAGRWRGGTGHTFAFMPYRAKTIAAITNAGGAAVSTHNAMGLFGGYPVPTSAFFVRRGTNLEQVFAQRRVPGDVRELQASEEFFLRGKSDGCELLPGDVFEGKTGGGGGYGDPLQREPAAVARDVALGYVSRETAAEVYGVLLTDAGEVDEQRSEQRRGAMLEQRRGWKPASSLAPGGDCQQSATPASGEPERKVHEYVRARDIDGERVLVCSECGTRLADYRGNYKLGLLVDEGSVTLIPQVEDPSFFIDEPMVFRRFCCPRCLVLMATEIVRASDPIQAEMVFA